MTATAGVIRHMEVQPPSARAELGNVVRFSMVVVIGVWMYLATDSAKFRDPGSTGRHLLPFQVLIQDRPPIEQRMFRELQEGLLEAETRRADRGTWPVASALAADGIPPFAPDPTAKGGPYDWRLIAGGTYVNYLGLPTLSDAPAWLVLVQEPEPGAPPDPAREDEEHHRLITGVMLHVSTWVRANARVTGGIIRAPQAEGWTQLYAVGPSLSQPPSAPPR
jgi:hypothetical protein